MTTQNNQQWHNFALRMDTISLRLCYRLAKDLENGCENETEKAKQLITELNKQSQNVYELCIGVSDELNQPLGSLLPQQATFNINGQLIGILQAIREGAQQLERYTSLAHELGKRSGELQKDFNRLYDQKVHLDEALAEHTETSARELARQHQQVQAATFQTQTLDRELQRRIADARAFNARQLDVYQDNIGRLSTLYATEQAKNDTLKEQLHSTNNQIQENSAKIDNAITQIKGARQASEAEQAQVRSKITTVEQNIIEAEKKGKDPNAGYKLDEKTEAEVSRRVQEELQARKQQLGALNQGINEYIERTNGIRSEIYAAERLKEKLLDESKKLSRQHALQQDQNVIEKIHSQQVIKNNFLKQTLKNLMEDEEISRLSANSTKTRSSYMTARRNFQEARK